MYSFLKDGEFVQISVEDQGKMTGFVSRYRDGESEKGEFLDQYFRSGKLDGNTVSFTTETVRGVWFEFKGTVGAGTGEKSWRRGLLLRIEGNSYRKHQRCGEENDVAC